MVKPADHSHVGEVAPMRSHFPADVDERFLGALKLYPKHEVYEGISPEEQVILVMRKHWITLLRPLFIGAAFALLPIVVVLVTLFGSVGQPLQGFAIVFAWYSFTFVVYYFIAVFLRYITDVWVVTDLRVIDMDTNTIALKSAREVDMLAIAAVEHHRGGGIFFGGLNRGQVVIRVIGEEDYYIPNAPMPAQVAQVIRELVEIEQKQSGNARGGATAVL